MDILREMGDNNAGGAYIRVMPHPLGGSTVPVGPTILMKAEALEQELETLLQLAASR